MPMHPSPTWRHIEVSIPMTAWYCSAYAMHGNTPRQKKNKGVLNDALDHVKRQPPGAETPYSGATSIILPQDGIETCRRLCLPRLAVRLLASRFQRFTLTWAALLTIQAPKTCGPCEEACATPPRPFISIYAVLSRIASYITRQRCLTPASSASPLCKS
jgi:hypothetical protein